MELFFAILLKIIPLYFLVILGFIAGKYLDVNAKGIGKLIIYIIAPIVIFEAITHASLSFSSLFIPIIAFSISSFIAMIFFYYGKYKWGDSRANVLAIVASEGNTGYFGIPIALLLFDQRVFGIYIMGTVGITLFENTVVFYLTARGRHTVRESIKRLIRLPALYAFVLANLFLYFNITLPSMMDNFISSMRGAYIVLGMMLIGFGISGIKKFSIDYQFITLAFIGKFILWPLLVLVLVMIDYYFFGIYDINAHRAFILLSIVPIAANTVVFATALNIYPEKVSTAVLFSTFFGLLYVPIVIVFLFK